MVKIFGDILGMSFNSVWLIIGVIIVRAVLKKSPKYFRKILWALVGLRLVIPFSFESVFSLIPHKVPQTADRVMEQVVTAPVQQGISFTEIATVLWLCVALGFLIYGIFSYIKLKLKLADGVLVKDNIYQSDRIQSPFVCGFFYPKIYMPYGLDEITQSCVLQHEKTHIKYADHFIKAIGFVILCVHWFNPLVWISYFLLCKDIELSCDESVIKKYNADECREYASALLDLGVSKVKFSGCPIAFGEVSIKTRIKSVIGYKKASGIIVAVSLCLCVGVSLCLMTEPEVPLKEKDEKVEVMQEEIEHSTEDAIAPATEKVKEPTTEPTTEPATEVATEPATYENIQKTTEVITTPEDDNVETTELFLVIEAPAFRNPFDTTRYVEPDTMRDKAYEAGVFVNAEDKSIIIDVLEREDVPVDDTAVSEE